MIDRESKTALFDGFADVAKALANGRRIEALDVLANGPRSVERLAEQLHQSVANTSQHLQVLRRAGLVTSSRRGASVVYRLAGPEVFAFLTALRRLASERLDSVDRLATAYLGTDGTGEAITREQLAAMLRERRDLLVIDVRPLEEYEAGHIPGAISISLDELPRATRGLDKHVEIVTYCRGRYCAFSHAAVRLLRRRGFKVRRLEDGFPEWEAERLPLERGGPDPQ